MISAPTRFSYGGHFTFPVRYGWLPKGLGRLTSHGGFYPTTETADDLGLGSKMVVSLGFWLKAMGLSADVDGKGHGRCASQVAKIIAEHDRYFELPGTWWFLHLALATHEGTVWSWFFNDYSDRIFDRLGCTDTFLQFTRARAQRSASPAMAQKDVACLLAAYASRPGVDFVDPDDLGACPLRELGLIIRHDTVNRFERTRSPAGLPLEAFLACVSALAEATGKDALSLRELATLRHGPGRVFCAGLDAIEDLVDAVHADRTSGTQVETLAGERHLRVKRQPRSDWLSTFFSRMGGGA